MRYGVPHLVSVNNKGGAQMFAFHREIMTPVRRFIVRPRRCVKWGFSAITLVLLLTPPLHQYGQIVYTTAMLAGYVIVHIGIVRLMTYEGEESSPRKLAATPQLLNERARHPIEGRFTSPYTDRRPR